MVTGYAIALTEAASFTIGCAMLQTRRLDPELTGKVLTALVVTLGIVLLIVMTARYPVDTGLLDPGDMYALVD